MKFKIFTLQCDSEQSIEIYRWCSEQFGEEFKNWKYIYGTVYHQFVIQGQENIMLFVLAWNDLIPEIIFI
jgi:hypothetical protein